VARGEATIYPAIVKFLEDVPQNELSGIKVEDREFYSIGALGTFLIDASRILHRPQLDEDAPAEEEVPLSTFLLNTIQETRVSSEWPLSQIRSSDERYPTPAPVTPSQDSDMEIDGTEGDVNAEAPVVEGDENAEADKDQDAEGEMDVDEDASQTSRKRSRQPSAEGEEDNDDDDDDDDDGDEEGEGRRKRSKQVGEDTENEFERDSDTPKKSKCRHNMMTFTHKFSQGGQTRSSSRLQAQKDKASARGRCEYKFLYCNLFILKGCESRSLKNFESERREQKKIQRPDQIKCRVDYTLSAAQWWGVSTAGRCRRLHGKFIAL